MARILAGNFTGWNGQIAGGYGRSADRQAVIQQVRNSLGYLSSSS
jgi:hypothetical protein